MDYQNDNSQPNNQVLELVMQDVLDGMLEMSLAVGFEPGHECDLEILEIAPEQPGCPAPKIHAEKEETEDTTIIDFPLLKVAGG